MSFKDVSLQIFDSHDRRALCVTADSSSHDAHLSLNRLPMLINALLILKDAQKTELYIAHRTIARAIRCSNTGRSVMFFGLDVYVESYFIASTFHPRNGGSTG